MQNAVVCESIGKNLINYVCLGQGVRHTLSTLQNRLHQKKGGSTSASPLYGYATSLSILLNVSALTALVESQKSKTL